MEIVTEYEALGRRYRYVWRGRGGMCEGKGGREKLQATGSRWW